MLEVFYRQAYLEVSMHNNEGTTCFEFSLEYDNSYDQEAKWDQHLIGDNVCVQAESAEPVPVPAVWQDIDINRLIVNSRKPKAIKCSSSSEKA